MFAAIHAERLASSISAQRSFRECFKSIAVLLHELLAGFELLFNRRILECQILFRRFDGIERVALTRSWPCVPKAGVPTT
jgi:hypothetical protein